jgi:hypothetical protein
MNPSLPSPAASTQFGFTCKAWIAYQLEALYLSQVYYVWFSKELNPIDNGDSSNPLELYRVIDRAVKKNDANHPKLKDLKANLLLAVRNLITPSDPVLARQLKRSIRLAPIEMFRPQLWRIDLSKVATGRWNTHRSTTGWDEQYVTDLKDGEFDVIGE